jgi:hypothetical protein
MAACLAACATTSTRSPAGGSVAVVEQAQAVRRMVVVHAGRQLGELVRFEAASQGHGDYWSVRNRHGQELGLVDGLGRAWRRRAHAQPEWLATGTVEEGTRAILSAPLDSELIPAPMDNPGG